MKRVDCSRIISLIVVMCFVFFLGGCLSASSFKKPEAGADYGPMPVNYEETIKAYFEELLFDPYSAKYKFGELTKAYTNKGALRGGDVTWLGYAIEVEVNAKNKYGGYVGYKRRLFLLNGETIYKVDPFLTSDTFHRVPL